MSFHLDLTNIAHLLEILLLQEKKKNEMCAINSLKACTLSRISSVRVTFYIQNCFYSELLKKKKIP